jgi:hypothetical protein
MVFSLFPPSLRTPHLPPIPRERHTLLPREWEKSLAGTCIIYVVISYWLSLFLKPIIKDTLIETLAGTVHLLAIVVIIYIFCEYRIRRRRLQFKMNEVRGDDLTENRPFVLYIRAFVSGGRLLCRNSLENAGDRTILGRVWDAELNVAAALERFC